MRKLKKVIGLGSKSFFRLLIDRIPMHVIKQAVPRRIVTLA